ncbi:hypothetical protein VB636_12790 [Paracoccus sp. APAP_BH8]|uniref:Uncharacterized protein n=1 Tax=Paracoccus pantotrophus TaxID=82367 RepID=A0A7H9C093_PARPN|nr:hypothetical protein [Paracoccus pantotrophus]MDF3854171.1 hypothetical protein [Paracoccus pantotrophus]QLH16883.1 hypothetical protein HYQ43_21990 [Paracoccus pantotrophus]RNI14270.1 hypothetical protein EB844_19965 [Paracoccus pantotrophus]SFO26151.1 hypothetical protein SAMN04244567_01210 [Paracoccus pantotrophus]
MSDAINFTQGAFAVYDPDDTAVMSSFIPFRFNPESLTRQLQLEQAQGAEGGAEPGAQGAGGSSGEQGADASSGTLKESFSVVLRFDLADRVEAHSSLPVEFGVLPEISALEELLYPVESETEAPSDGSEPVRARGRRPIVLFIWGERRVVPVKITGMAIAETFFNGKLYPVRAEIEVGLEVLGEAEARDNTRVQSSLNFTAANRRKMARLYLDTTADQGTSINLPQ